jgi:glycosyltransferase involved in cell wall biosynthesis
MGAGICVLTSDIPENREVIADAGFTFRSGNVLDLARVLGLLLSDPERRMLAGQRAQARVREKYLWPGIAEKISYLYAEITGRARVQVEHSAHPRAAEISKPPHKHAA